MIPWCPSRSTRVIVQVTLLSSLLKSWGGCCVSSSLVGVLCGCVWGVCLGGCGCVFGVVFWVVSGFWGYLRGWRGVFLHVVRACPTHSHAASTGFIASDRTYPHCSRFSGAYLSVANVFFGEENTGHLFTSFWRILIFHRV